MSVSVLVKNTCQTTGEGPFWDATTKSLLYVDITQCDVHRWNSVTGHDDVIHLASHQDDTASFIIPRSSGGYVVGLGRTVSALDWDSKKIERLCEVEHGTRNRFNDAKCDAAGRLWTGTMGYEIEPAKLDRHQGSLYSFDNGHVIQSHLDKIDISNGLAWSLDNTVMYFIDTLTRQVYAFDYDISTGSISRQRIAVDFGAGTEATLGYPDGMTIDHEGKLWVACYGAGKVIRFDPETGKQLQVIDFPVEKTTSCCFGGVDYSELYVTSGRWVLSDEQLQQQPLAGSVFKVTGLGVHGFAAPTFAG